MGAVCHLAPGLLPSSDGFGWNSYEEAWLRWRRWRKGMISDRSPCASPVNRLGRGTDVENERSDGTLLPMAK
jgi:hypothetical protein